MATRAELVSASLTAYNEMQDAIAAYTDAEIAVHTHVDSEEEESFSEILNEQMVLSESWEL